MMMKHLLAISLLLALLFGGCRKSEVEPELYGLPGLWMLSSYTSTIGRVEDYSLEGMVFCRIYSSDTTYYDCQLMSTPSGIIIIPQRKGEFEIIDKGGDGFLYFEDGHPRPMTRVNDTTLVIQKYGADYTWILNRSMSERRMTEIRDIIANDTMDVNGELMSYVLSTTERELQTANYALTLLLVVMAVGVIFILEYLIRMMRHKKKLETRLQEIMEESSHRPELVRNALRQVEEEFLHSSLYLTVRGRVEAGEMLRTDDWEELESGMRPVYANFFSQLPTLCKMSLLERRVCLLIKLRFSPSEMATVLCKDISTISSIRSRLFKKVFQHSGGAKDWDEFIHSL